MARIPITKLVFRNLLPCDKYSPACGSWAAKTHLGLYRLLVSVELKESLVCLGLDAVVAYWTFVGLLKHDLSPRAVCRNGLHWYHCLPLAPDTLGNGGVSRQPSTGQTYSKRLASFACCTIINSP
jgi:hypothetical protein